MQMWVCERDVSVSAVSAGMSAITQVIKYERPWVSKCVGVNASVNVNPVSENGSSQVLCERSNVSVWMWVRIQVWGCECGCANGIVSVSVSVWGRMTRENASRQMRECEWLRLCAQVWVRVWVREWDFPVWECECAYECEWECEVRICASEWVSAANVKQMFEWAYESVSVNKSINESVDANAFVSCEWGGVRMIVCECEYTSVWMWHACIYTNTTQNHTCMLWINRTNRSKQIQGKNNKQTHTHWLDQDHSSLTQSMYSLTHTNALTRCQSCQGNKVNCERTQCQMPNVKC